MKKISILDNVIMPNNDWLTSEEIEELVTWIINKFAEKKLSANKAEVVLDKAKKYIGDYAVIQPIEG